MCLIYKSIGIFVISFDFIIEIVSPDEICRGFYCKAPLHILYFLRPCGLIFFPHFFGYKSSPELNYSCGILNNPDRMNKNVNL